MGRAILIIGGIAFLVGVIIYALIDCIRTEHQRVRGLPKPLWAAAIVLFPLIGAVLWLVLGKTGAAATGASTAQRAPSSPDDDEDYLRFLEQKARRERESREREERRRKNDGEAPEGGSTRA